MSQSVGREFVDADKGKPMKLHDMKRTPKEKKAREREFEKGPVVAEGDYHHGLRVHLDHESMDKVGMKKTPKPGDEYEVRAHARVISSHESADEGGSRRHVELLLHRMGAAPKDDGDEDDKPLRKQIEAAAARHEKR